VWLNKPRGAVRILFVGDVYGKPGVEAVKRLLPGLLREGYVDFCIVNGENAEQGKGIVPALANEIFAAGADVITGGNHSLYRDKIHEMYDADRRLLRPLNFPEGTPGRGSGVFDISAGCRVAVVNLQGRAMLTPCDDPFRFGAAAIEALRQETPLIIVDFHAEATAEKIAFTKHVDGSVTAIIGTHTHVPTADENVSESGTAFITDVGMTGPHAGVIGMKTEHALHRFLYPLVGLKSGVAEGDVRLSAVAIDADPASGHALAIQRFQWKLED
jgi:2',3'-cyclic-nucleotide 2'-phosphodiesterase